MIFDLKGVGRGDHLKNEMSIIKGIFSIMKIIIVEMIKLKLSLESHSSKFKF
jgi:hypothetical protein